MCDAPCDPKLLAKAICGNRIALQQVFLEHYDLLIKHIADTELDREVAVKIPRKGQLSGEDASG